MKSFNEYVNEAKQNYIFGGTDDRNTAIEDGKPFSKLKHGENIYVYVSDMHHDSATIVPVDYVAYEKAAHSSSLRVYLQEGGYYGIKKEEAETSLSIRESVNAKTGKNHFVCLSTDQEDLKAIVKQNFNVEIVKFSTRWNR